MSEWNWSYGWWEKKKRHLMPMSLGKDPRNYVLTENELKQYLDVLDGMEKAITKERSLVFFTHKALSGGFVRSWDPNPQPITFGHVMQFVVTWTKQKLALVEFLVAATSRYAEVKNVRAIESWDNEGGRCAVQVDTQEGTSANSDG